MDVARMSVRVDTSELERAIALAEELIGKYERIAELQLSGRLDEQPKPRGGVVDFGDSTLARRVEQELYGLGFPDDLESLGDAD